MESFLKRHPEINPHKHWPGPTLGQRAAEAVAGFVGSWKFIAGQSVLLLIWVILNVVGVITWDTYPFILMNLMLSMQAAYTAPMILMSANRQAERDREVLYGDYVLDAKTRILVTAVAQDLDDHEERLHHIQAHLRSQTKKLDMLVGAVVRPPPSVPPPPPRRKPPRP